MEEAGTEEVVFVGFEWFENKKPGLPKGEALAEKEV